MCVGIEFGGANAIADGEERREASATAMAALVPVVGETIFVAATDVICKSNELL